MHWVGVSAVWGLIQLCPQHYMQPGSSPCWCWVCCVNLFLGMTLKLGWLRITQWYRVCAGKYDLYVLSVFDCQQKYLTDSGRRKHVALSFSWGSEWMSLLASLVIPLSIKLIFPFSESCLSCITTRLNCREILMSWHLMSSHCHGLNERNWEGGRRRQEERHHCMHGVSCISSKPLSFTHHWCSL